MNELRISGHSNMVIGTKQIFKREKIDTTKNGGFGPRFFGPRFKKCSPKMPNKREGPAAFLKRGLSPGLRPRF